MHFAISICFALSLVNSAVAYVYTLEFTISGSNLPSKVSPVLYCIVDLKDKSGVRRVGKTSEKSTPYPNWSEKFNVEFTDGVNGVQQLIFEIRENRAAALVGRATFDIETLLEADGFAPSTNYQTASATLGDAYIPNIYPGDIYLEHRITKLRASRCGEGNGTGTCGSAPLNHISLPYNLNLLVLPSLNYVLRH